jgi:hypothetical protein
MKVSLNWLKDYVEIRIDWKELIDLLTMAGLEVEGATSIGEGFDKVVVAEILSQCRSTLLGRSEDPSGYVFNRLRGNQYQRRSESSSGPCGSPASEWD